MTTFADQQPHYAAHRPSSLAGASRAAPRASHYAPPVAAAPRVLANPAVQRLQQVAAAGLATPSTSTGTDRLAHDFSRLPVHAPTLSETRPAPAAPAAAHGQAADGVRETAARGTLGSGAPLPHAQALQHAFGHHDLTGIRAYVGGPAAAAARALGAAAYATGDRVAFGAAPTLHTAAHEAAHVVQQRRGVQLADGIGTEDDPYERHADAVADLVVQGRTAEGLLDRHPGGGAGSAGPAIQRDTKNQPDPAAAPPKETPRNATLDTTRDTLIQAFDDAKTPGAVTWNLDLIVAKAAIGLKSSPKAAIEVIGNWQPDPAKGSSVELQDKAVKQSQSIRKAIQQWGAFADERLRATTKSVSIDGSAPAGSFHDYEVWFRTGTAAPTPSLIPPSTGIPAPGGPKAPPPPGAVPPEVVKRMTDLGDLIAAAGDAVTKDPIVRELRALVVKIQPFMPDPEMKKSLDDAIVAGVGEGIKAAIKAALEAITGKKATDMPAAPSPGSLNPPESGQDATILKSPEIPLDKVPDLKRYGFEFQGLRTSYQRGERIGFKVRTPDDFEPNGQAGAGRVVILEAEDFKKNGRDATSLDSKRIASKGTVEMGLAAPDKPGDYVLGIRVGFDLRVSASSPFKVQN